MAKSSELKRLEERRETIKMSLRCLRSDVGNPARIENEIARLKNEIITVTNRIAGNEYRMETMHEDLISAISELASVNKSIKLEKNDVKVRAFSKLAAILQLSGDA